MSTQPALVRPRLDQLPRWQRMLIALAACTLTTAVATPLHAYLDLANIIMLFLLTVLIIAMSLERDAAIAASALSVMLFDIFFVPPRFSLAVSNIQYLITFAVMLTTALVTTHFTARLKQRAEEALLHHHHCFRTGIELYAGSGRPIVCLCLNAANLYTKT